jgi:hypothetical protein
MVLYERARALHKTDDGRATFAQVIGEQLSAAVVSAFNVLPAAPHVPRVSIGKLVVSRESWQFAASDIGWATVKDEPGLSSGPGLAGGARHA